MATVTLYVKGWRGPNRVALDDAAILLVGWRVEVGALNLSFTQAMLEVIDERADEVLESRQRGPMDFLTIALKGVPNDERSLISPEEWLMGSDEETLLLPVSALNVKEAERNEHEFAGKGIVR